ncbi:hypothetical protein EsH8_II_000223 [Colletotrichum jinshuiense]
MSAVFTFGSLGDILTLCQIAMALGKAVGDSQGSAKTYQALKNDIDAFVHILMKVLGALQEREHTEWVSDLEAIIKQTVDGCANDLREALVHFRERYDGTLGGGDGGARAGFRAGLKKMEFRFREEERLQKLQDNICASTARLTLLVVLHSQKAARVSDATMAERMEAASRLLLKQADSLRHQMVLAAEQSAGSRDLMQEVCEMGDRMRLQEENGFCMMETLRSHTQSLDLLGQRISDMFSQLAEVLDTQTRHRYFAGPDPTFQKPVIFEDALGHVMELPLGWIRSWDHLETNIRHIFEDKKGYNKVLVGEYCLEEEISGTELDRSLPWTAVFRAGMKINMCMIFLSEKVDGEPGESCCPGCGTQGQGHVDANIQW